MANAIKLDPRIKDKVEILNRCDCSRDVYEELNSAVELWYWECDTDTFKVSGEPWGAARDVEMCTELLSDLREYTEMVRCDSDIPDRLDYITPFWNKVNKVEDDE